MIQQDSEEERVQRLKKQNEYLFQRVDYLEQVIEKHRNLIDMLSKFSDSNIDNQECFGSSAILKTTHTYIKYLVDFEVSAFFLVDEEDCSFFLADSDSQNKSFNIQQIVDTLIDEGEFAWALSQNNSLIIKNAVCSRKLFLHVLATKKRTRGMFIAVCREDISDIPSKDTQSLLSIVLQSTAQTLESIELYRVIKNTNESLERANDKLELRIKARTQQLEAAVDKAEQATLAKSQFLANMSHEIRTPMNAIINLSQLALEGSLSTEQRDYIEKVALSGNNLLSIINDILDFSKIEAGKLNIEYISLSINKLLDEMQSIFTAQVHKKDVELKFDYPMDFPALLMGDPIRIKQVLINFINNAIKFTQHGHITVSVRGCCLENGFYELQFFVEDTGIGISVENQRKLFQSFSQADSSTSRKFGGTGLGLSISKQLVELMGGSVHLKSELNKGSTFGFTLQFKQIEKSHNDLENKVVIDYNGCFKGIIILLAEDNKINQMVASKLLKRTGCDIIIANNGQQAVDLVTENPNKFDVILMDLQMPVMDGLNATLKIRETHDQTTLPILAMTADAMGGVKERCIEAGMNDYISKPINFNEMLDTLSKWVKVAE